MLHEALLHRLHSVPPEDLLHCKMTALMPQLSSSLREVTRCSFALEGLQRRSVPPVPR